MGKVTKSLEELNAELEQRKQVLEFQKKAFEKILKEMNEKPTQDENKNIKEEND